MADAMNRREFLQHTILGGAATTMGPSLWPALSASVQWPIGCFNRPWTTWRFDEALKQIWYDAGNIIYYTGKNPVEELKPIAQHVTGFCAKDCGALQGDVMIQFGTGKWTSRASSAR